MVLNVHRNRKNVQKPEKKKKKKELSVQSALYTEVVQPGVDQMNIHHSTSHFYYNHIIIYISPHCVCDVDISPHCVCDIDLEDSNPLFYFRLPLRPTMMHQAGLQKLSGSDQRMSSGQSRTK